MSRLSTLVARGRVRPLGRDATISGRRSEEERGMHLSGVATAVIVALGLLGGASSAAAEPSVEMFADTCAVCHGTDGRSPGSIDDLYRMDPDEFVEEMVRQHHRGFVRLRLAASGPKDPVRPILASGCAKARASR